jgi:hypothetical protein
VVNLVKGVILLQIYKDAGTILAALDVLSNIKLEEPSGDQRLGLPYIRKED